MFSLGKCVKQFESRSLCFLTLYLRVICLTMASYLQPHSLCSAYDWAGGLINRSSVLFADCASWSCCRHLLQLMSTLRYHPNSWAIHHPSLFDVSDRLLKAWNHAWGLEKAWSGHFIDAPCLCCCYCTDPLVDLMTLHPLKILWIFYSQGVLKIPKKSHLRSQRIKLRSLLDVGL